jgi:Protein of unknown function (DUF3551)
MTFAGMTRCALMGLLAAGLTADLSRAGESFFNQRFCTQGGGSPSNAIPDCSYNTWQQCVASARGLGRYCSENPFWRGARQRPATSGVRTRGSAVSK